MKWETFMEKYKPVKNNNSAPIDGFMFETFGEEYKKVISTPPLNVWTIIDGEGTKLYLINGWHIVNRLGYIITLEPWKEGDDFEIIV